MSALAMTSFKSLFTVALAGCVSVVLVGCADESGKKVADGSDEGASKTLAKPADNTKMATLSPAEPVTKKPVTKKLVTKKPVAKAAPAQATSFRKAPPTVVKQARQPEPTLQGGGSRDDREQATKDTIYAAIRVRMEQAILQRRELLDAGRAPSDVEIRGLEGQIMKARSLLIEVGEEVEDVEPPLLTKPQA